MNSERIPHCGILFSVIYLTRLKNPEQLRIDFTGEKVANYETTDYKKQKKNLDIFSADRFSAPGMQGGLYYR